MSHWSGRNSCRGHQTMLACLATGQRASMLYPGKPRNHNCPPQRRVPTVTSKSREAFFPWLGWAYCTRVRPVVKQMMGLQVKCTRGGQSATLEHRARMDNMPLDRAEPERPARSKACHAPVHSFTAETIASRSAWLSAGCTGKERTSAAAFSVSGKRTS